MSAARREVVIVNKRGLHARASAKFVAAVSELSEDVKVTVAKDGNSAGGASILGLMMLGAAKGDTVELAVQGGDSEQVLAQLCSMIEEGFGED